MIRELGVDRRRRHQLHREHRRGHRSGRRAREPATLRDRGHGEVPTAMSLAVEPLDLGETEVVLISYELAGVRGADLLPKVCTRRSRRCSRSPHGARSTSRSCSCASRVERVSGAGDARRWRRAGPAGQFASRTGGHTHRRPRPPCDVERRYDRVAVSVLDRGVEVLDVSVEDPRPIAADDIQYVVGLNRGVVDGRGERLVQVEPHFEPLRAERGRPRVAVFDAAWFGDPRVTPVHPVAATISVGRLTLPPPRSRNVPTSPCGKAPRRSLRRASQPSRIRRFSAANSASVSAPAACSFARRSSASIRSSSKSSCGAGAVGGAQPPPAFGGGIDVPSTWM